MNVINKIQHILRIGEIYLTLGFEMLVILQEMKLSQKDIFKGDCSYT